MRLILGGIRIWLRVVFLEPDSVSGFFPKVVSGSAFFSRRLELDPVFFSKGRIPVKSTQIRHPEYKILN